MNAAEIPIPTRLKTRPQWRGMPIPYIATIGADGEPDFRLTDETKRQEVIRLRHCQLCGQRLGLFVFFVGGASAAQALAYFEPGCHLDCMIYAMRVCPFIVGKMQHADMAKVQADHPDRMVMADLSFTPKKSDEWVIIKATGYTKLTQPDGIILLRPKPVLARSDKLLPPHMTPADWLTLRDWLFNTP